MSLDQTNGKLTFLNTASANGKDTTHLSVHPSGKYLLAANYTSGDFPVFRILSDGSIGPKTDEFQSVGNGTGPNPARQEGPHAHQILTDLDGNHIFGVDLGADKVNVLNLNLGTGVCTRTPCRLRPWRRVPAAPHGLPPHRHARTSSTSSSPPSRSQRRSSARCVHLAADDLDVPKSFTGTNTTAEIRIHPSGRFLYNTNRGHNSITMFEIDQHTGRRKVIGWHRRSWSGCAG